MRACERAHEGVGKRASESIDHFSAWAVGFSATSRFARAAMAMALATRSGTPACAAFSASAKIAASETYS